MKPEIERPASSGIGWIDKFGETVAELAERYGLATKSAGVVQPDARRANLENAGASSVSLEV